MCKPRNDTWAVVCHAFRVKSLRLLWVVLVLFATCFAQEPQAPTGNSTDQPQAEQAEAPHHISKEEAEKLFQAVDEILKFDSERTGLPIKHPVKRKLTSREEVEQFFLKAFREDESAKRLQSAELVLKKFGLIPRDSSLTGTLLALYTESVAGYYDPKTKTVYLLDWLDADSQKPVLAHELTHALQDQNFDIQKYFKLPKNKQAYDLTSSEEQSARVAAMEGQAAATMVDYLLQARGLSLASNPDIAMAVQSSMLADTDAPIFAKAPLYLREDMKFPYTYGLNFTLAMLKQSKTTAEAYSRPFLDPPANTRQIMDPDEYLAKKTVPRLAIPDLDKLLGKEWERFDVDCVGQFDISVLAREYGKTAGQARSIADGWRNSYYYAAIRKATKPTIPKDLSLLYVSRWSSADAADMWAATYASALGARYRNVAPVEGDTGHWKSEEGDIFIERHNDLVLITESFDPATSKKLRAAALAALNPESPKT